MTITVACPSCSTSFPVDPNKVPEGGVHARCSTCSDVFFVEKPDQFHAPEAVEPTPDDVSPAPDATAGGFREGDAEGPGATTVEPPADEALSLEEEEAPADDFGGPAEAPSETEAPFGTGAPADVAEAAEADDPVAEHRVGEPEAEAAPGDRVAEPEVEPDAGDWVVEHEGEPAEDTGPPEFEPMETIESAQRAESSTAEAPPEEGAAPDTLSEPATAPQGFQFGRRDPHDKARRLARVLVSDMIMYNPERHQRALSEGSLQSDFEDEIKKSWEEYIEQVGAEIANDTTYFTDALNDILAKGEQIFHGQRGV